MQGVEVHGGSRRNGTVAVFAQQARGGEVADRAVKGIGIREALVADEHFAPQLIGAKPLGVQDQEAREHGDLPGLVRELRLGRPSA
jgi:hypothetical protein